MSTKEYSRKKTRGYGEYLKSTEVEILLKILYSTLTNLASLNNTAGNIAAVILYNRLKRQQNRCYDSFVLGTGRGGNRADNKTIPPAQEHHSSHLPRVALDSEGSLVHMGDGKVKPTQRLDERQVLLNDQVCPLASKHGVFLQRPMGTHETPHISSTGW